MNSNDQSEPRFPIGLKIAAYYLIISATIGIVWPLLGIGPNHPEFMAKSFAYKLGAYFRSSLFDLIFIISGIGILLKKPWARKTALVMILVNAIYATNEFAWGFARGKPSLNVYIVSFAIIVAWSFIWFYLIYKKSSAEVFNKIK